MRRLCLTVACLASAVAWTQASAENPSADPTKSARPHAAKAKHPAASKSASVDGIHFSDPYGPPEGATLVGRSDLVKRSDFPFYKYPTPKEPQAGLSISMQKDGGGHTTGGFGWNF
jgi:hypothetical protein